LESHLEVMRSTLAKRSSEWREALFGKRSWKAHFRASRRGRESSDRLEGIYGRVPVDTMYPYAHVNGLLSLPNWRIYTSELSVAGSSPDMATQQAEEAGYDARSSLESLSRLLHLLRCEAVSIARR